MFRTRIFITLIGVLLSLSAPSTFAQVPTNAERQEAERLWELMLKAKGGRERLLSVNNVQLSAREKYWWWFKRMEINYDGLFVFPDKSWEWDDQRGTVFGMSMHIHNFETNKHLNYVDTGKGGLIGPIHEPSRRTLWQLQLHLLGHSKWVQPIPQRVRTGKVKERDVDIVETMVQNFRADERKIEFALDKKSHLPIQVIYYWVRNGEELSGGVYLSDYVEVDGIKMPSKVGRVRAKYRLNVEYDQSIFEHPPNFAAGIEGWKRTGRSTN